MKSIYTLILVITTFAVNSFAETSAPNDKKLQELKVYMQCAQTVSHVAQYLPPEISKNLKTTTETEHTDIWWTKKDNSNLHVRIASNGDISSQTVCSLDQPQSSLQPVTAETREAFIDSLITAYREHLLEQFKSVTPHVLASAANQPAGFTVARDNFRKAYLSGNHACDSIQEKTFAGAFANTEDTVLSGFIQLSQQATASREAANTRK